MSIVTYSDFSMDASTVSHSEIQSQSRHHDSMYTGTYHSLLYTLRLVLFIE